MLMLRKKPLLLHYYITERCNARCTFCGIYKKKSVRDANRYDVIRNLADARDAGCRFVDFTGGEPLMHRSLPLLLDAARDMGYITSVTTNGILFPGRAQEIITNTDLLHISLNGSKNTHNRLRGVKCFDKVMESLEICAYLKKKADVIFTYNDQNYMEIAAVYRIAAKYGLMVIADPVFNYFGNGGVSMTAMKYISDYSQGKKIYVNRAFTRLRKKGGNNPDNPVCRAVRSTLVINPENRLVLPCYHRASSCLDLRNGLDNVLNTPIYKDFLNKDGTFDFCRGCAVNCYFDPSFVYRADSYFFLSMISKLKYAVRKYIL
ncbi:MAG: radical SAM/SPASM domain-containing protein [Fibrobacterota bacterium]